MPGGILIGDADAYDTMTRLVLSGFFERVAADVAAAAPDGARVLEIGCGPGHLSILLAGRHGFDVTGLDLDPSMIERAHANADRRRDGAAAPPTFMVGDVASLPFPDESFDLVVSTLSIHHWSDPAGLAEIGRVLHPDGRSLVWDLRPGIVPFHRHVPDPVEHARGTRLRVLQAAPWPVAVEVHPHATDRTGPRVANRPLTASGQLPAGLETVVLAAARGADRTSDGRMASTQRPMGVQRNPGQLPDTGDVLVVGAVATPAPRIAVEVAATRTTYLAGRDTGVAPLRLIHDRAALWLADRLVTVDTGLGRLMRRASAQRGDLRQPPARRPARASEPPRHHRPGVIRLPRVDGVVDGRTTPIDPHSVQA